ncbi:MAG: HAMP domain-containing sensor histidine kinase [Candidatus Nanopelagicales bacterium]
MNRLRTRLILTHVLVAVVGAVATYVVVRLLAPALFDQSLHGLGLGPGGARQSGQAQGAQLRASFATAVEQALLIGAMLGALAAAASGAFAAYRVLRPLARVQVATRRMAAGEYDTPVPLPHEKELADVVGDVNSLGAALAQTEQRRVRLLGEVAHEMRTPLTVIDGYVEGMLDEVLPRDDHALGQIAEEVRRLTRLAVDLSALSRAQEQRFDLKCEPVDIGAVVRGAAERLRTQAEEARVELTVLTPEPPVQASADADRVAQVVTNLVGNALRATTAHGTVTVTVHHQVELGRVSIAVSDTGVGLEAEDIERVFERFYRAGTRRRLSGETGSGIGLTIARDIMRAHGGDLAASSDGLGHGARFTAWLPLR